MKSSHRLRSLVTATGGKFLALVILLVVFTTLTLEYRHLVDESVSHLRHRNSRHPGDANSPHRCHNCLTSQPQGEIATWNYQPESSEAVFAPGLAAVPASPLPLFQIPAERAPPAV